MRNRPFQPSHLYVQVRRELARRIASDEYPPGSLLPNEFSLANEMQVSVGTIRKAVEMLTADRLVRRMQGRGTVVADRRSADYRSVFDRVRNADGTPISWEFREGGREVRPPTDLERRKLELNGNQAVIGIRRLRETRDQVVASEYSCMPFDVYGDIESLNSEETTVEALSLLKGIAISSSDERLTLVPAPADAAEEFGVPIATAIIRLDRMVYDANNRPIEWRISYCNLGERQYHVPSPLGSRPATEK